MPIILPEDFEEKPLEDLTEPPVTPEQPVEPSAEEAVEQSVPEPEEEESESFRLGPIADREFLEKKSRGELEGVAKAIEENVYIPIVDMLDGSRDADQVAEDRAQVRRDRTVSAQEMEEFYANDKSFAGETIRALAGGVEDLVEGAVNLPGDALSLIPGVDDDFLNVDFNFVRENNTQLGDAARTLTRYLVAARQGGRLTGGRLTAGQTGGALFAGRAGQGFIEDFIGADGTAEDDTLIGRTPWTSFLQTSDDKNPIANRALVGLEGAAFEALAIGPVGDFLKKVKVGEKAGNAFTRVKDFADYRMSNGPSAKKNQKAYGELLNLSKKIYFDTDPGDISVKDTDNMLSSLDKSDILNNLIDQVSGRDNNVRKYLILRLKAQNAAEQIDQAYDTVKYGGAPDEEVVDMFEMSAVNARLEDLDNTLIAFGNRSRTLDEGVAELSETLTRQSSAGPGRSQAIQQLQVRALDAPRLDDVKTKQLGIPMNLSAGQVKFIQDLRKVKGEDGKRLYKFPKGITITPGRRIKGLTSENIDEFLEILGGGTDGKIKTNLLTRLGNVERPQVDDFGDTVESLTEQIKQLQAEDAASGANAAASRQALQPMLEEQISLRQQIETAKLEREALYAKMNGKDAEFKAKAESMKTDGSSELPAETIDAVVKNADESIAPTLRKDALRAGKNADELVPTKPRAEFGTPVDEVSGVNTAKTIKTTVTEAEQRSLSKDVDELVTLNDLGSRNPRFMGATDSEIIAKMQDEQVAEIKEGMQRAFDTGGIDEYFDANPDLIDRIRGDKYSILSVKGQTALHLILKQTVQDVSDLAKTIDNQTKDGAPEAVANLERLTTRFLTMFNLAKNNSGARGSLLRELNVIADNLGTRVRVGDNPLYDELIARQQDTLARQEILYKQTLAIGDEIRTNPQAAARKLSRAVKALAHAHADPEKQINIWKTLLSANLKNADGFYITSILSGPETQARNFWGNFYQTMGHPLMASFGASLPGKNNKAVRLEAQAVLASTYESLHEIRDLFTRLWSANVKGLDDAGSAYSIWDEGLTKNMAELMELEKQGKLNWAQQGMYGFAVNMRKILMSPYMQPMMRVMGTVDSFFRVTAGRQVVTKRAVADALDVLGEGRPLTDVSSKEFAELVQQFKKKHELEIFAEDKLTLIDPEAEELAGIFTFQKPINQVDDFTKNLNTVASIPGARLLGLTFVKTPSEILKASFNLTPGLSSFLKSQDQAYKNGTPFYRAMRDGQEAMSYVIGIGATAGGAAGFITGAGPLDRDLNDKWRKAGNKPFTIKLPFGGEIGYQALEPATTIVGTFADIGAIGAGNQEASMFGAIPSNIVNKSFLTQLATAAQIITATSEKDVGRFAENIGRGLVPYSGMRSQVGKVLDPMTREYKARLEPGWSWFLKKNGGAGLTRLLPERKDPLTDKPLTRDGYGDGGGNLLALINMFSPLGLRFSQNRTDPVHKDLYEWGFDIDDRTKAIDGVDLTNEEMVELNTIRSDKGKFRQAFLDYFNSDQYLKVDKPVSELRLDAKQEMSDTEVYKALSGINANFTKTARNEMTLGTTDPSKSFSTRWEEDLNNKIKFDRQAAQRQDQLRFNQN